MSTSLNLKNIIITQNKNILLNKFNHTFEPHTITSIIGHNGSGKTTLLKNIMGIITTNLKNISFNNKNLNNYSLQERSKFCTLLLQPAPTSYFCTGLQRIAHGLIPNIGLNTWPNKQDLDKIKKFCTRLNISHLLSKKTAHMSSGEAQLINLAKNLINSQTKIILLDEPSVFLDISQKKKLISELKKLSQEQKIIIFTSHDTNFISSCAHNILEIKNKNLNLITKHQLKY